MIVLVPDVQEVVDVHSVYMKDIYSCDETAGFSNLHAIIVPFYRI